MEQLRIFSTEDPETPLEIWELRGVQAVLVQHNREEGPLYPSIDGVGPEQGGEYLRRLKIMVAKSSYLQSKDYK